MTFASAGPSNASFSTGTAYVLLRSGSGRELGRLPSVLHGRRVIAALEAHLREACERGGMPWILGERAMEMSLRLAEPCFGQGDLADADLLARAASIGRTRRLGVPRG